MKSYFPYIKAIVFDIDYTLYRHDGYYKSLSNLIVERYAKEISKSEKETKVMFLELRKKLGTKGKIATHTFTLEYLGISIDRQSEWKNELFKPEKYLTEDKNLIKTIKQLSKSHMLFAFTNNTTFIAKKTLRVLGVESYFIEIWGSEKIQEPKPTFAPYLHVLKKFDIPMHSIVAIGDRYNVDLSSPVTKGCAGILVESMEDIYNLTNLFSSFENV